MCTNIFYKVKSVRTAIASDSSWCKRKVSEKEFGARTNGCEEIKNIYSNAYLTYITLKNVHISRALLTHRICLPNVIYIISKYYFQTRKNNTIFSSTIVKTDKKTLWYPLNLYHFLSFTKGEWILSFNLVSLFHMSIFYTPPSTVQGIIVSVVDGTFVTLLQ